MPEIQPSALPLENLNDRKWVPILLNRTAGPKFRAKLFQETLKTLRAGGLEPEPFDSDELVIKAVAEKSTAPRCIAAAGGDGTVLRVVNLFPQLPIAIIPLGSQNLLAKQFRITQTPDSISAPILAGRSCKFDAGRLNGNLFTLMASAGFDADVVRAVNENRHGHVTKLDYIKAALTQWITKPQPPMTIRVGQQEPFEAFMAFVFNFPAYALNIPICPHARATDGQLNLIAFRFTGRWRMFRDAIAILTRRHLTQDVVVNLPFKRLEIASEVPIAVQSDGDFAGMTPCSMEVAPQTLQFLANAG